MSREARNGRTWSRFVTAGVFLTVLQVPGCWCEPVPKELFSPFPGGLGGGSAAYCPAWAESACTHAQRCDPPLYKAFTDQGGCVANMRQRCERENAQLLAAETQGRANYDPLHARGCLEQEATRGCHEDVSESCANVFEGNLISGQPCDGDLECAPGLFCSGGPLTCGLCVGLYPPGGPCWGPTSCEPGLACVSGRCTRPLNAGASCYSSPEACPEGSTCFPFIPGLGPLPISTCTAPLKEGAPCDRSNPLAAPCVTGLVCATRGDEPQRCRGPVDVGQTCDPQGVTAPLCQDLGSRLFCDGTSRTCKTTTVVIHGAACGDANVCSGQDRCVAGSCEFRPRHGESCTVDAAGDPCFESRCTQGLCVQPARLGERCDAGCPGLDCVSGLCGKGPCDAGEPWDAWVPPPDGGENGVTP
jgi:hypothetical protein